MVMLSPPMIMEVSYKPIFVLLSFLVAIFASFVALNLASSVNLAKGKARIIWLSCGALAMGLGIWSMHFVGMLAFNMPGMEMAYDIPLFLLSIAIAVAASALALYLVSRPLVRVGSIVAGGFIMAIAIAGMHYTGMYSMRMAARIEWNYWLVALSVLIALGASFAALLVSIRYRNTSGHQWPRTLAGVIMGVAIAGMHYTGMAAATFIHDDTVTIIGSDLLASDSLALAVTGGTLLILGLALLGIVIDRMLASRTKRAEESERLFREADKAIAELQREREIRDRLVSAMAHDLRTPLAAARMSVQLGARNSGKPEIVERQNAKAVETLTRMDQMIQDLLDAHRISAGQSLPLSIESCEVSELLKSTVEDLITVYGNRFAISAEPGLTGYWDHAYLRRALENLCTNAVKYGKDGAPIAISARMKNSDFALSVHNEGNPLSAEDQDRLFVLFRRGKAAEASGKHGWGLGLTIVKGVAEAHGGKVEVMSSPQAGTTFTLVLPQDPRQNITTQDQPGA